MSYYTRAAAHLRGPYDFDAVAFFLLAGITNMTQKNAVNKLVIDLKAALVWSKIFALYPFVGGSASAHSYNLKNPAAFQITWNGTVTHSSNGVTGNGSTGYGDTGFNINTSGGSGFTSTSAAIAVYIRTSGGSGSMYVGSNYSYVYDTGGSLSVNVHNVNGGGGSTVSRLVVGSHISGTTTSYRDGTSQGSGSGTAFSSSENLKILSGNGAYYSSGNVALVLICEGLTSTEVTAVTSAVNTFETALSRNV